MYRENKIIEQIHKPLYIGQVTLNYQTLVFAIKNYSIQWSFKLTDRTIQKVTA